MLILFGTIRVTSPVAYDAWHGATTSWHLHSWTLRATHALSSGHATERWVLTGLFLLFSLILSLSGHVRITTDGPDAAYVPEF
jgi:hypothetical protein